MEIKVEEIQALEPIKWNYEDAKQYAMKIKEQYGSLVYTEDNIVKAKEDRATLNNFTKAINNERLRIEREFMKPFEPFKNQCKEVITLIDDAAKTIDKQVKEFEEKQQNEKREQIEAIFNAYIGQLKDLVKFELIFNPRWLNKTYTIKNIEKEINSLIIKSHEDLAVIDGQIKDENINKSVKSYYFSHINNPSVLGDALQEGMRIEENNKKLEELKQQQDAKKEENAPKVEQDAPVHVTEEIRQIDFRVWITNSQIEKLKAFFRENGIKFGSVK